MINDDKLPVCEVCGALTHDSWECPYEGNEDEVDEYTPDLYTDDEDYENERDNQMSWGEQ